MSWLPLLVLLAGVTALADAFAPPPLSALRHATVFESQSQNFFVTATRTKGAGVLGATMAGGKGWYDGAPAAASSATATAPPTKAVAGKGRIVDCPILAFVGEKRAASIGKFEKFDDQIMGGMSQSAILPYLEGDEGFAAFTGVVRVEGGGFCGSRLKLLDRPLDLSRYAGVYLKAKGDGKTYKLNVRTTPTAGEAVYQAEFTPPPGPSWSVVRIPWKAFRLVKRAVPVEGGEPLTAASVYQFGFVLSKFSFGEESFNDRFSAGAFRLEFQELGVYEDGAPTEAWVDKMPGMRGESIDITDQDMIQDSVRFTPNGKKRPWWGRLLIRRVRKLLSKRVSKRRSAMAVELLAKRKEGARLSEIRLNSWVPPKVDSE